MPETLPQTEGRIPFKGHSTWYTIVGEGEEPGKLPLLLLHGGPGGAHDYMESMGELARGGRRVIMYDQLGCGKSPVPSNPDMWTVELFVEEVDAVRQALGLERLHILGQSWGGMLGMEYALTQPEGVESLVICDSPARMDLWVEEANRLRAELPPEVQATLLKHEQAGTTDDPAYEEACLVFYNRHVCRVPWSESVARSFAQMPNEVYMTMNGPSEFHCIGTLRTWDVTPRLGEITRPDAGHLRALRRGDAAHLPGGLGRHPRVGVGAVRGELAHAPRGGAGAVPAGGRRLPRPEGGR